MRLRFPKQQKRVVSDTPDLNRQVQKAGALAIYTGNPKILVGNELEHTIPFETFQK